MKNKLNKKLSAVIIAVFVMLASVVPVSAYVLNSYRHISATIYYYYDNWAGTRAISYFSKGASAWSEKTTQATLNRYSSNTGYDVYMSAASISNVGWDGLCETGYDATTGYVTSQKVTLNMSQESWNDDNALKSVIVHEVGHVFGLADNGKTKTIMNAYTYGTNSRYGGYGLTTPQADDVNGVNLKY